MRSIPKVGDIVIPHALSVSGSENSKQLIGKKGKVVAYPTPMRGVRVEFFIPPNETGNVGNDFDHIHFVYWPKDLELVERKGLWGITAAHEKSLSQLKSELRDLQMSTDLANLKLKVLREQIAETSVRVRKPGEVWQNEVTGVRWLVRAATPFERRKEGASWCPLVCLSETGNYHAGSEMDITNLTDEYFHDHYKYIGKIYNLNGDDAK